MTSDLERPVPKRDLSEDEVLQVIQRAHNLASDLSRASMHTAAPLCLALDRLACGLEQSLRDEGL